MAFARRSLRSFQVLLLQRGNAAFAAWTAWSRPSFWVSVTLASSSPVTGSEIFIVLEESILWPFTIFGNPAVRRAFVSACSRLGWGIDGGAVISPRRFERTRSEISCCGLKLLPVDIVFFSLNESVFSFVFIIQKMHCAYYFKNALF